MRHLLLLRHARAAPGLGGDDHERPLSSEGRLDAQQLAARLAEGELRPGLALCSSALRARETLEALRSQLQPAPVVEVERGLYLADALALLERLGALEDRWETVLVVAHNPAIAELAQLLVGREGALASGLRRGMPAGTLATLCIERGGWADLAPGRSRLVDLLSPDGPS